jgi:hypothetical protein
MTESRPPPKKKYRNAASHMVIDGGLAAEYKLDGHGDRASRVPHCNPQPYHLNSLSLFAQSTKYGIVELWT